MIVIVGCLVVIGAVLGGFTWAGGSIGALLHPSEVLTIVGASLGAMMVMSPKKVLIDLVKGLVAAFKGSPYNKKAYTELFKLMFELLKVARQNGLLALEPHLNDPHHSAIFQKYPTLHRNHHVVSFISDGFAPIVDGTADAAQVRELMESELRVIEEEHHAAVGVLQKAADALPGFGIVAAVLGIVITMGAIDGPVHEIGHKVGAALVGTFLGILLSYGFFGPLASRMEFIGSAEMGFYRTISCVILGCVQNLGPKVALEQARRGVGTEYRPKREELDQIFRDLEAAG